MGREGFMHSAVTESRVQLVVEKSEGRGARIFLNPVETISQDGPQSVHSSLIATCLQMRAGRLGDGGDNAADGISSGRRDIRNRTEIGLHKKRGNIRGYTRIYPGVICPAAKWLAEVARAVWPAIAVDVRAFPGNREMIALMQSRCAIVIPYDCDRNHEPAMLNGCKAHWCLAIGFVLSSFDYDDVRQVREDESVQLTREDDIVHLMCLHGKSRHAGVWNIDSLRASNANLCSTLKDPSEYVIPTEGVTALQRQVVVLTIR